MTPPQRRKVLGVDWAFAMVALGVATWLSAADARAAARYDPRLRFRTIRTAHFDVHFHQGEEALARRLAQIVERVRLALQPTFGLPRGRVRVILVDQNDISNGWATPIPYDAVELTAIAPPGESLIGNTTDWLELVFTHEYTHILHLDRSRGFMQGVRRVFGRVPVAFPNTFLPIWQIEGIATFEESRMTGEGRVPAGDFRAIVDVAAARGRFEPFDRASGGLDDWPWGFAPYAYGAYFHQFLADRYGAERLNELADATSTRIPLFGAGAFRKTFGRRVGDLWADFRAARERAALPRSETDARARRLTHHGFVVSAPRLAADGVLYYRVDNADAFPALMARQPDGTARRLAWRVAGERTTIGQGWVVFDQLELTRSTALRSDLYAVRPGGGAVRRLTRNARAVSPDVSPDGGRVVCTVQADGRRALAMLAFRPDAVTAPLVIAAEDDANYAGPRWSPDGRQIVAERQRPGVHELVLVDPVTHDVRPIAARSDARLVTPSWTPDGRTILFSADPGDQPFNVFALDVSSGAVRQVTDSATGAQFPELAPDGSLIYLGYTPDGYDLFSVEFHPIAETNPATWRIPADGISRPKAGALDSASYQPLRTLAPTFWEPLIKSDAGETVIGAATSMFDALGRHAYEADAGWTRARARPDWHLSYAYDRWRPTLVGSYSDDTDPIRGGDVRSREAFAGALLPFRHLRGREALIAGFDAETDTFTCTAPCRVRTPHWDLRSVRAGWLHDSRRRFGYSISPEEGFGVEVALETSRRSFGSDADNGAAVVDIRGFRRIFGPHTVLAARVAGAAAWGALDGRRFFSAAGPGPSTAAFDFGRDTIGLLRGFARENILGSRAAVANLDLRVPIARVQRGLGSWPIFFRSVHAAAFLDSGSAWDSAFRAADLRTSLGGELSLDAVVIHNTPFTLTGGAAWLRDPLARASKPALFWRIGYAF